MTGQSGWRALESWPIRLEGHEKVTNQSDYGCTRSSSWTQIKRAKNLVKQICRSNWTFRTAPFERSDLIQQIIQANWNFLIGLFKRSGLLVLIRFITDHFPIDQFVWMICSTRSDLLKDLFRKFSSLGWSVRSDQFVSKIVSNSSPDPNWNWTRRGLNQITELQKAHQFGFMKSASRTSGSDRNG